MKTTQQQLIRDHLKKVGSITRIEADHLYRVACITKVVSLLRSSGLKIKTIKKQDNTGKYYARYQLLKKGTTTKSKTPNKTNKSGK